MALTSGTRLGPYEINSPLGAGGMGEVYRARDSVLGRDVAVKVLPSAFSEDPDRLRRFQQEAQAAAALNHPNILAIYHVGQQNGTPYIVSELLEGESLRQRLQAGALPVRKAIDHAVQVARGLAAAHDKGIVHRDLKPENIFVLRDGRVKILDFGLAKLTRPEKATSGSDSPTLTRHSEPGFVLGTVGYMSPEQIRGGKLDPRSDIFSLGAILYETLSGKRAFQGETAADTMSVILTEDPPALPENRRIPPALERIVRHCLEKNQEERFQSARDVAFDLESLSLVSETVSAIPLSARASRVKRFLRIAAGLAILASLVGGALAVGRHGPTPLPRYQRITFRSGTIQTARFAVDGQSIVYSASWEGGPPELFATRPSSPESRPMALKGSTLLSVSPSGEIALLLGSREVQIDARVGTLARVPLEGGVPREVISSVESADWAPDGTTLLITHESGGEDRLEFPPGRLIYKSGGNISNSRFSPRGDRIAFFDHPNRAITGGSVAVVDLKGNRNVLSTGWTDLTGLAWSPRGDEVWFTGDRNNTAAGLFAVNLAGREREVVNSPGDLLLFDIARDGRVLLGREDWRSGIYGLAPGETKERDLSWLDYSVAVDLSDDGRTLLLSELGEGGGPQSAGFLRRTDGSPAVKLSDGPCSSLSRDGQQVICGTPEFQLNQVPTKTGEIKALTRDHLGHFGAQWLPDGKRFLFVGGEPNQASRLFVQEVGSERPRPITSEGVRVYYNRLSHDAQRVAVPIGPEYRTMIYPVNGGEPKPGPGLEPGEVPVAWSTDDRYLICYRLGDMPVKMFRVEVANGRRTPWKELEPPDPAGIHFLSNIYLSADEKSYVYSFSRKLDVLYLVQGLK